ncbi:MAG TPA: single-stranded-DNA-specific exonuclease RecJ [Candidatus Gracilibacteria bacterium]|nr:single-stranded-DNA-specific exonuclease RecJ [Candidatus Gracilibacteria bacterium]
MSIHGLWYDQWIFPPADLKWFASILKERELTNSSEIENFLYADWQNGLHSPHLLKDYLLAGERIAEAIRNQEKIMVFGDYDVDGVVGVVVLFSIIQKCGGKVSYRVPHRQKDGYGLKSYLIDEMQAAGVNLLITVDNGITAANEIAYAKSLGMEVVVVDHHVVPLDLPPALAIVNHQQNDCTYPWPYLCGAALAYKVGIFLAEQFLSPAEAQNYVYDTLDLVAIATIADVVPLKGENRMIVKGGLEKIRKNPRPELKALARLLKIDLSKIDAETIAFQISPLLNASGRIYNAYTSIQFLLGKTELAKDLINMNFQRKEMVKKSILEAELQTDDQEISIVHSETWHPGIIGLIAGRMAEKYYRPAIALTRQDDTYVASARSIKDFDLFKFLNQFRSSFLHFGGHAQAAGFSIASDKLEALKEKWQTSAAAQLSHLPNRPSLQISANLGVDDYKADLFQFLQQLAPYGAANPLPQLYFGVFDQIDWKAVGMNQEHLTGSVKVNSNYTFRLIKFNATANLAEIKNWSKFHLVGRLLNRVWQGESIWQIEITDLAKAD